MNLQKELKKIDQYFDNITPEQLYDELVECGLPTNTQGVNMPQDWAIMDEHVVAFMKDLRDIMIKHKVEISASDDWQGYAECGEDIQIHIETDMKNIDMGHWITPEVLERYIKVGEGA